MENLVYKCISKTLFVTPHLSFVNILSSVTSFRSSKEGTIPRVRNNIALEFTKTENEISYASNMLK